MNVKFLFKKKQNFNIYFDFICFVSVSHKIYDQKLKMIDQCIMMQGVMHVIMYCVIICMI